MLAVPLTLKPMEAEPVEALPTEPGWHFEPKYDGFRCIAFRDGTDARLQSRNGKPLDRFFPELVAALASGPERFVIDGEVVIPDGTFELLQLRLHPAASRIAKLAAEHPARITAFDLLADASGASLMDSPFAERRTALERLLKPGLPGIDLARATGSAEEAMGWIAAEPLEGIVAKRLDLPYRPGERAMLKWKRRRTIDCVPGGVYRKDGRVDSLLLGLYDEAGLLHYVGRVAVGRGAAEIGAAVEPLLGRGGFTGRAPGGRSRWTGKERAPEPIEPSLVVEVSVDHITGDYMRHGARLVRWRDDKAPRDCTIDQIRA